MFGRYVQAIAAAAAAAAVAVFHRAEQLAHLHRHIVGSRCWLLWRHVLLGTFVLCCMVLT